MGSAMPWILTSRRSGYRRDAEWKEGLADIGPIVC
jgi:hypothetical protein